jgi:hypothetical protein
MKKGSTQILSSLRSLHGLTDASTLKRHVEDSFASQHLSTNSTWNERLPLYAFLFILFYIMYGSFLGFGYGIIVL